MKTLCISVAGTPLRRYAKLVCLLLLVLAGTHAAVPSCCDDDCADDEAACIQQCGSCGVTIEPAAAPALTSLAPWIEASWPVITPPFNDAMRDILHVPRRLV